ncbi:DUF6397 family protein [Streptomyces luomodiensis]|uniref:DUF6397 family protein n=1 Tax=Streptomyces luomodiensis TaxID=3026192 RepID=A0ABY9UPF6_9ACTN|nr:DUF6397 family protein [Streptomyces sp. SCA4-21]WNE94427.1 DUF6397 family protein [Streptomyces sp. SCA4-21]
MAVRVDQELRERWEPWGLEGLGEPSVPGQASGPGDPRGPAGPGASGESVAFEAAARALGLKPREFELAVQLGEVRTVTTGLGRRVACEELRRVTAAEGFPEALIARLRVVGTAEGAELLGISQGRLTRLARGGFFAPVRFYVNRYRAVVWLYPATELTEFAVRQPELLSGRTPPGLSAALAAGEDWRAAKWRRRRVGGLLTQTEDPWERAAVLACVLGSVELASAVSDPYERAHLRELRPALVRMRPEAGAVRDVIDTVVTADDPREIRRYRAALASALDDARRARPAPRPAAGAERPLDDRTRAPGLPRSLWQKLVGRR